MKRYIKASTASISGLAKFLKQSVNTLLSGGTQTLVYPLYDPEWGNWFSVCVGWCCGYDEDLEWDVIQKDDDPECVICCKICNADGIDLSDYDMCGMPYDEDEDELYDTNITLNSDQNYEYEARYLLNSYDELIEQIDDGVFLPEDGGGGPGGIDCIR